MASSNISVEVLPKGSGELTHATPIMLKLSRNMRMVSVEPLIEGVPDHDDSWRCITSTMGAVEAGNIG